MESIGKDGDQVYLPANLVPIDSNIVKAEKKIGDPAKYLNARNRKQKAVDKRKSDLEDKVAEKLQPIIKSMMNSKKKSPKE